MRFFLECQITAITFPNFGTHINNIVIFPYNDRVAFVHHQKMTSLWYRWKCLVHLGKKLEIAYILIQCDLGAEVEIIEELSKIEQIKEVRGTYGIYDVFCRIEADSKNVLDDVITFKIRKVPKIRSTITLHWIPSQGGR